MQINRSFATTILTFIGLLAYGAPVFAGERTIAFAGLQWIVKNGSGMGPGSNTWSDATESVWVDAQGLHLKIRRVGDVWTCAEVISTMPTTNGLHRFYVQGRYDEMDPSVVFSPFLYADDVHEIDVEMSRWGDATNANTQFVIQPAAVSGNITRFDVKNAPFTTHYFDWQPTHILFKSFTGHSAEPSAPANLLSEWNYAGSSIPSSAWGLNIHINLWLNHGMAPGDGKEVEMIVKDVDYPGKAKAPGTPATLRAVQ